MKKVGIGVLIVLGVGLLIWLNCALFAGKILGLTPEVRAALQSDGEVTVALLEGDSWLVMIPGKVAPTTGLILYPEGHMDIRSYALVSREIARQGFQVVFLSRRLETEYSEAEEQQRIEAVANAPLVENIFDRSRVWEYNNFTRKSLLMVTAAEENSKANPYLPKVSLRYKEYAFGFSFPIYETGSAAPNHDRSVGQGSYPPSGGRHEGWSTVRNEGRH